MKQYGLRAMSEQSEILRACREWRISARSDHPRIYFTRDEIPGLKAKAEKCKWIYDRLMNRCDGFLKSPIERLSGFDDLYNATKNFMIDLCVIYVLTDDERYAEKIRWIIQRFMEFDSWILHEHMYPPASSRMIDLAAAEVSFSFAVAYDCLYDYLSQSERRAIENAIDSRAIKPFLYAVRNRSEWWIKPEQASSNWRSVICGDVGSAACALAEKLEDAKTCIEEALSGVISVLDCGGIDGGWSEGIGYWGYGIGRAVHFADIIKRASDGMVNLFAHPYLRVTGNFGLYCETPDGGSFNFSDCRYEPPNAWLMARLAREYRNPYWQWCAERNMQGRILELLYYDPSLKSRAPLNLNPSMHFKGIDVAVLRSGWSRRDTFVGFKSGSTATHHPQLDINSFIICAYGRRLVEELGLWSYAHASGFFWDWGPRWDFDANSTLGHNTILVDGEGQRYGSQYYGRIVRFFSSKRYDYLVSEGHRAYGNLLDRFVRFLVFLKPNLIVIVDDLRSSRERRFEWLLHYSGRLVELNDELRVINDTASLDVLPLKPAETDDLVIGRVERVSIYNAEEGRVRHINRYLSISPLHRKSKFQFVIAMYTHPSSPSYSRKWTAEISKCTDESIDLKGKADGYDYMIKFNLAAEDVTVNID